MKREQNRLAHQAWCEACAEYHELYLRLHTSYQLYPNETQLKQKDPNAIQIALDYLSADLYYFSSGYNKELITTLLKQIALSDKNSFSARQFKQLEFILLNKVNSSHSREFRYYCRLAKVLPIDSLPGQLITLTKSQDPQIRLRAKWMLKYLGY